MIIKASIHVTSKTLTANRIAGLMKRKPSPALLPTNPRKHPAGVWKWRARSTYKLGRDCDAHEAIEDLRIPGLEMRLQRVRAVDPACETLLRIDLWEGTVTDGLAITANDLGVIARAGLQLDVITWIGFAEFVGAHLDLAKAEKTASRRSRGV